jgi:hypothetical protein
MVTGMASLQAQALDLEFRAVALWDGRPGGPPGGTASVVDEWSRRGTEAHVVALGASGGGGAAVEGEGAAAPSAALALQQIKPLLFAEVMNFQKIGEEQMPAFVEHFKGGIARLMEALRAVPSVAESWAGAHFFAFDDLEAAARLALAIRDFVARTPWAQHGLPADLGMRTVLHAGPVFSFVDPTLRRPTIVGAHLNRVARIWPIVPAGQIYATQGFAALCGAEHVPGVSFEYLGYQRTTVLFEDTPLFRMDRRR